MPLVFVHGVNNRRGTTPAEHEVFDNYMGYLRAQFANVAFAGRINASDGLKSFTPYWGDAGVRFARNLACVPKDRIQALAVGQPEFEALLTATAASLDPEALQQPRILDDPLLTLTRTRGLASAVDLLFAAGAHAPMPPILLSGQDLADAQDEAARLSDAAERYAAAHPSPAWLAEVDDDEAFVDRLVREVRTPPPPPSTGTTPTGTAPPSPATSRVQTLGWGDKALTWLGNAATGIRDSVGRVATGAQDAVTGAATQGARKGFLLFSGMIRPTASAFLGRFMGDVFTYLDNRQPILDIVLADIDAAVAAIRPGDDELYLVGHSFGGIILFDILSSVRPELKCALYVTVGSQVALFAEMGRLRDNDRIAAQLAQSATSLAARPDAAARWINVYDPTDYVGFATKDVFDGVLDFEFATDALPIVSHGAYFDTPRFFARLRERVAEVFPSRTNP